MKREEIIQAIAEDKMMPFIQPEQLAQIVDFVIENYQQPMPNSTQLIELWHEDKEMLKEKDFRGDQWRLAYNAFMCGFGRGIAVKKQEQPYVDLEKEEFVGVAESPLKTFQRVNEFEVGASYRH